MGAAQVRVAWSKTAARYGLRSSPRPHQPHRLCRGCLPQWPRLNRPRCMHATYIQNLCQPPQPSPPRRHSTIPSMTQVHISDTDPREHYRCAVAFLALALVAAVATGAAVALTWDRPQLPLALLALIYAMFTGLLATERAADHLAAARP